MQKKRRKNGSKDSIGKLRLEMDDLFKYYNERMHEFQREIDKLRAENKRFTDICSDRIGEASEYYENMSDKVNILIRGINDIYENLRK